ncbi:hypothetical protein GEMRC1_011656 [Eukaryota sp. GEM-RC1]
MKPWLFFEVCHKFKDIGIFSHKTTSPFEYLNSSRSLHIISKPVGSLKHGIRSHVSVWKPGHVTIEGHQSVINTKIDEMKPRMIQYHSSNSPDNSFVTRATITFDDEDILSPLSNMPVGEWLKQKTNSGSI